MKLPEGKELSVENQRAITFCCGDIAGAVHSSLTHLFPDLNPGPITTTIQRSAARLLAASLATDPPELDPTPTQPTKAGKKAPA